MSPTHKLSALSDEDIQAQLAGESFRGPRTFRARELAPLTRGLRALRNKVVNIDDPAEFHDCALLHILAEAHASADPMRLEKRRALIAATDDVATFRATVSLLMDELDDAAIAEARRVTNEILGLVEQAEVSLAKKNEAPAESAAPSPMTTLSPSSPSPGTPAGAPDTSSGS